MDGDDFDMHDLLELESQLLELPETIINNDLKNYASKNKTNVTQMIKDGITENNNPYSG